MTQIIGVRFKDVGKIYYFEPGSTAFVTGDMVIVETTKGIECGRVVIGNKGMDDDEITTKLKTIIRKAGNDDLKKLAENKTKETRAFKLCREQIKKHNLAMHLVDVEYTFDGSKILFYFTADARVDFRDLVKDLAALFRTRIELRQIGVRDEAKLIGGLGICGNPFCCSTFLGEFQPVSIKMAKEQNVSLNPVKISGTCGRLMCCLKYEQDAYSELLKGVPKVGAIVNTPKGRGIVLEQNVITGTLRVKLDAPGQVGHMILKVDEVVLVRDGKTKLDKEEMEKLREIE